MARNFWPKRGASKGEAGLRLGFRSGLEEKNAEHLDRLGVAVQFETMKIKYVIPASVHSYTPDFPLPNGIIVETKGRFLAPDRAKHMLVKQQHPELDIRFVFSNPKSPIATGSKTTVSQWADKYGFKWATKLVPPEWLLEPGPEVKPEAIIARGVRNS